MNPAFVLLVLVLAAMLWVSAYPIFRDIGQTWKDLLTGVKESFQEEDAAEKIAEEENGVEDHAEEREDDSYE